MNERKETYEATYGVYEAAKASKAKLEAEE